MFYKFNNVIGRITQSTQNAAYMPQGLKTAVAEPTPFVFDSKMTQAAKHPVSATSAKMSTTGAMSTANVGVVPTSPGYKKIMSLQEKFAVQDGLYVWQKMGARDKIPYLLTLGLSAAGICLVLKTTWDMAWPKKSED